MNINPVHNSVYEYEPKQIKTYKPTKKEKKKKKARGEKKIPKIKQSN